jgi:hypothetical protein
VERTSPGTRRPAADPATTGGSARGTAADDSVKDTQRWRFWVAVSTSAVTAVALAIGVVTPPHAGPYCRSECVGYPYTGGAEFMQRDLLWIYPAAVGMLLAVALVAVLGGRRTPGAALLARLSTILAAIAAGLLVADYGIQLTVVQAALARGETDGLGLLSQYNPHGVFIALENVGYLLLGIALAGSGAAMAVGSRLRRATRAVLLIAGAATVAALIGYATVYRADLDYRFEVAGIAITWLSLIVAGILTALDARQGRGTSDLDSTAVIRP